MEIEEVIIKLRELHSEMGEWIDKLEVTDNGEDIDYYTDILRDIDWDNRMLKNRYKKIESEIRFDYE